MRFRTLIAAGALAGALAAPAPARAETCAAAVRSGEPTHFIESMKSGLALNSLLLRPNEYLQVFLPKSYVDSLSGAAAARPEAERKDFVRGVIEKNVEAALGTLAGKKTAKFECAVLTEPIQPAPAPKEEKPKPGKHSKKAKKDEAPKQAKPNPDSELQDLFAFAAAKAKEAEQSKTAEGTDANAKPAPKEEAKPQAPEPPKAEPERGRTIRIPD